jgi:hypothetical protein
MTGYGFCGPMTASGTIFSAKDVGEVAVGPKRMMMMGIGSYVLWLLLNQFAF